MQFKPDHDYPDRKWRVLRGKTTMGYIYFFAGVYPAYSPVNLISPLSDEEKKELREKMDKLAAERLVPAS